jgi:hypothetical protein
MPSAHPEVRGLQQNDLQQVSLHQSIWYRKIIQNLFLHCWELFLKNFALTLISGNISKVFNVDLQVYGY